MGIGLSFGKKKSTEIRDTSINKMETGLQNTNQTTTGKTTGSETTTSSQTNTSTGSTTTTNRDDTRSNAQTTQTQTGRTSSLSAGLVSGIEGGISQLLGDVLGSDRAATMSSLAGLQDFDIGSFVDGIMGDATQRINRNLQGSTNSLASQVGGTAGENSNVALLTQQLAGDAAGQLAGIRSQAVGQGQDILRGNAQTIAQTLGITGANLLPQLIDSIKGGQVTTEGTAVGSETRANTGQSSSQTAANESSTQTGSTQTNSVQEMSQLVAGIISSLMNTQGTESSKGTNKSSGGGFSLGL